MHDDIATALRILAGAAVVGVVAWLCWVAVHAARKGGKGVHAIGAALMLFGWGNLRDPARNPVAEANEGQRRRGESGSDPLDPW